MSFSLAIYLYKPVSAVDSLPEPVPFGVPKTDNPNVVEFVHPTAPHSAMLSTLPEEMMGEVSEVLQNWLQ